ncbi:MAG: TetR/AcrR family transcriptional regulator [Iamia sp.]
MEQVAADGQTAVDADDGEAPVDGRTARAHRTRAAIVEACVALVRAGDTRPTAPRIAEEAGVSVRSVFQHFDDLETLFTMVAERAVAEVVDLLHPIPADLDFEDRLARIVKQRADVLEAITPIRRAAAVHGPESPAIRAQIASGHAFFRGELDQVFDQELSRQPTARRHHLLDMLDVVATWGSWEAMRTLDGRSRDESATIMADLIRLVLEMPA